MADQVVPGPCPGGCPPPTEIECIQATKVYDFCFAADTNANVCTPIPSVCGTLPAGTAAAAGVGSVSCSVVGSTPVLNPSGPATGFADVTLLVAVTIDYTLSGPTGLDLCTFSGSFSYMRTMTLCAPAGTRIECTVASSTVSPVAILTGQVCATFTVCLLVSSVALVSLLVPSYGFCTPVPCVVAPEPPFAGPPAPLFPVAGDAPPPHPAA